jgi:hypothetical protein
MKQVIQSLKTGNTLFSEIPLPHVKRGQLLIKMSYTLVSAGPERMMVEFGKAGCIEKACHQADKVRMVLVEVKTTGLQTTMAAVFNKLGQPLPLGCTVRSWARSLIRYLGQGAGKCLRLLSTYSAVISSIKRASSVKPQGAHRETTTPIT